MLLDGRDGDVIVMSLGDRVELLYGRDSEVGNKSLGNKFYCRYMERIVR